MSEQEHGKLGALIIAGLQEAIRHARGEDTGARVVTYITHEDGTVERIDKKGDKVTREIIPPRAGWDDASARMATRGDDRLLDDAPSTTTWDEEEWDWPQES